MADWTTTFFTDVFVGNSISIQGKIGRVTSVTTNARGQITVTTDAGEVYGAPGEKIEVFR